MWSHVFAYLRRYLEKKNKLTIAAIETPCTITGPLFSIYLFSIPNTRDVPLIYELLYNHDTCQKKRDQ